MYSKFVFYRAVHRSALSFCNVAQQFSIDNRDLCIRVDIRILNGIPNLCVYSCVIR